MPTAQTTIQTTAQTTAQTEVWNQHPNPHVRLIGRTASAGAALTAAAQQKDAHFRPAARPVDFFDDYTQIDPALPLARDDGTVADPLPNTSYAGLTPVQRRRFANWLTAPEVAAPTAFRQIYLAWLECALFEAEKQAAAAKELSALLSAGGWKSDGGLAQAALLAGWLTQDGSLVARGLAHGGVAPSLLGVGAGWLAQWGRPLGAACAVALARGWNFHAPALANFQVESDGPLLELHITSLASSLGADPLAWALTERGDTPIEWLPWHCTHRGLRLLLPQTDLRPHLEPRLAELMNSLPVTSARPVTQAEERATAEFATVAPVVPSTEWTLLLEFGDSRSQHFEYALHLARKQPGYQMLMDETRQLVHRVRYRKRHMRQFWRLWAYVESWSSTKIYVNGQEVKKWNVYPYSAEMR